MLPPDILAAIDERFKGLAGPIKIDYFHQAESKLLVRDRPPCPNCEPTKQTLEEIAERSDQIDLRVHSFYNDPKTAQKWDVERIPGIVIHGEVNRPLRFYGFPGGSYLPVLVDLIVAAAAKPPSPRSELSALLKKLRDPIQIRVLGSLQYPPAAQAAATAFGLSLLSDKITSSAYIIEDCPDLVLKLKLAQVPLTLVNDARGFAGVTNSTGLAQFCFDMQSTPDQVAQPVIAPGYIATLKAPPPHPQRQRGPPRQAGPPRSPGGLILPGQ